MNLTTLVVHSICFSVSISLRITHPCCRMYRGFLPSKLHHLPSHVCPALWYCQARFIQMCWQSHPDNIWLHHFYPHPPPPTSGTPVKAKVRGGSLQSKLHWDIKKGLYEAQNGFSGQGTHDFVLYSHLSRPALLLPLVFMTLGWLLLLTLSLREWGYYCHKDEKLLSLCLLGRSVLGCWLLMSLGAGVGRGNELLKKLSKSEVIQNYNRPISEGPPADSGSRSV